MAFSKYRINRIGLLPGAKGEYAGNGQAKGINNAGQVVGVSTLGKSAGANAFLWVAGALSNLGDLPGRGNASQAQAINTGGQIVGDGSSTAGARVVLWQGGSIRDIGLLPYTEHGSAQDINDQGQVVGYCKDVQKNDFRGFLWNNGFTPPLPDLPGATSVDTRAFAINNSSRIVGYGRASDNTVHAAMWHNHKVVDLMVGNSIAYDINDANQVVGMGGPHSGHGGELIRAFLWENFNLTIVAEHQKGARAQAINNKGQVVGGLNAMQVGGPTQARAFIWQKADGMVDLNTLIDPADPLKNVLTLQEGLGINDNGIVVGKAYMSAQPYTVPFVATPI